MPRRQRRPGARGAGAGHRSPSRPGSQRQVSLRLRRESIARWKPGTGSLAGVPAGEEGLRRVRERCRWRATRRLPSSASDPRQPCAHRRAAFNRFAAEHLPVGRSPADCENASLATTTSSRALPPRRLVARQPSSPPWRVLDHACEATTIEERLRAARVTHSSLRSGATCRAGRASCSGERTDLHAC